MGYGDFNYDLAEGETYQPDEARLAELKQFLRTGIRGFGPAAADRQAWDRWKDHAFGRFVLERSAELGAEPRPCVTDELFMRVIDENSPACFNAVAPVNRERMTLLTLAECIQPDGRFLPVIEEDIRQAFALRTWIHPNNDGDLDNFEGRTTFIDLASAHLAANLVTISRLLGDRLPADLRDRIRAEVERRILQPYEKRIRSGRDIYWWCRVTHNWNSVCLGCVMTCALELRDTGGRAWHLAVAERLIRYSEEGFPDDGFYTEGLGYWNYGFGHYLIASELMRLATGGAVDWLQQPLVRKMARFGERMEIQDDLYPAVADCRLDVKPWPWIANWLNNRKMEVPDGERSRRNPVDVFAQMHHQFLPQTLLVLFGMEDAQNAWKQETGRGVRDWFGDVDYLISRPDDRAVVPLAATFKGGHNGVNHNHNDLGTFTVALGRSHLVLDPGAEVYNSRTFSKQRYEGDLLNSFGHPVPRVADRLQVPGTEAFATVLATTFTDDLDEVVLDLSEAYRVDSLLRLNRTFRYHRGERPWVEVIDEVAFDRPETFETAVITLSDWVRQDDGSVVVGEGEARLRVRVESQADALTGSDTLIDESTRPTRLAWTLSATTLRASVRTVVEPFS